MYIKQFSVREGKSSITNIRVTQLIKESRYTRPYQFLQGSQVIPKDKLFQVVKAPELNQRLNPDINVSPNPHEGKVCLFAYSGP